MQGIEGGIDKEATQAYLCSFKVAPSDKSLLRTIQAGGLWTQDRKFRAGLADTDRCPFCNSDVIENQEHI